MMARRIAGAAALALLSVLMAASSCAGRDFFVGGPAGWAPNPAEPFNAWAERNRFQVNDTLVFRYSNGADAVLVVTPGHYGACNATEPVLRLDGAAAAGSRFAFPASGPYFFISADEARCRAGERLIVVVLAVRDGAASANDTTPSPRALPTPPPPKSSSSPPPPVATPAPHALPTPPPPSPAAPGKNDSSPSPAPSPAPAPGANGTSSSPPPSRSSAVALRGGFLACLLIAGAAILV